MKNFTFFLALVTLVSTDCFSQRIRTDHREMTPGQKTAFLAAVNDIRADIIAMAAFHSSNFNTPIHSTTSGTANGKQFLPWHRVHQLEMEEMIRGAGTANAQYLTIPYWDWRIENTHATVTWDDAGFLALSGLHSDLQLTRKSTLGGATLAANADIVSLIALTGPIYSPSTPTPDNTDVTNSSFFTKRLEAWHNLGHVFVGGTMGGGNSPRDPVFFLHHGFVDKLWQDWEERDNAVQSVFDYTSLLGDYSPINPNTTIDSRYAKMVMHSMIMEEDVWYAYNKKLLLDGLAGNFNVVGIDRVYSYTPWNSATSHVEGVIYAGDVRRDASDNVVSDNKGGFIIKNGADCVFKSGNEIRLMSGFQAEPGSSFRAHIVTTPHGFSSPLGRQSSELVAVNNSEENELEAKIYLYPNPVQSELNIEFSLPKQTSMHVIIYNNVGQIMYSKVISPVADTQRYTEKVNFSGYSKGFYVVKLGTSNSSKTFSISK